MKFLKKFAASTSFAVATMTLLRAYEPAHQMPMRATTTTATARGNQPPLGTWERERERGKREWARDEGEGGSVGEDV